MDSAESSLSDLLQTALRQNKYDDVAFVAEALSHVTKVRQGLQLPRFRPTSTGQNSRVPKNESESATDEKSSSPPAKSKLRAKASGDPARSTNTPASKYPLFLKDDSRLIKVGWSRKKKDEYMHRVPKEVVFAFVEHLEKSVGSESLFEIESLFPVSTAPGEEIPGYQIYVIVAWLREAGVIEKKGRDGYIIQEKSKLRGEFNELWDSLQTRTT